MIVAGINRPSVNNINKLPPGQCRILKSKDKSRRIKEITPKTKTEFFIYLLFIVINLGWKLLLLIFTKLFHQQLQHFIFGITNITHNLVEGH